MISPTAMWQQVQTGRGTPNQSYFQVVKGLTNDTIHTFQVRAENPQGGSAPASVTATPVSQPSCTIDALGDRRLLWQGQLTAGIREISTDGNIETGYGEGGEETGTLTPDAFTFRSTSYSVYPRTDEDFLNAVLREQNINVWYPREEVVDALRVHVCNTPYDFSSATTADVFEFYEGYRWNVGSPWPPGIERTLRLSLPPNHAATGDPVISGTVQVGEELTAVTTGIMDEDVLDDVFTYQWVRVDADGTSTEEDITDATDATYTLTADDRGTQVKVEVRFVDILGGEETRTSAPTATLAGVPNTAATGAPTITGTAQVGQTLTAVTTGIMDADGLTSPTYTYQWIRVDGTDEAGIASANSSTYTLIDADLGTTLKVRATFDDDLGHTETLTSAATATVGAAATGPPTVTDVAVTSTPASGTTYYLAGEVIEFTVTFSAPVTVTATPKFAFRLGAATRQAAYASGSDSTALVFARMVQAGEVDRNGISWNALALALDGGTITQTGATTAARLTHAAQAPLEGHRVDAAPPMQVSASVQGLALVLVYDEPLDPASMPATGAYTVTATVGATTTNPAVSEVSIYGIWVTLTLDAAPAAGATVTLAYAPPASNPVQDEAGNDAPAFSGQSVRLGAPVTPPGAPQNLSWAPGDEQVTLSWDAPSSDGGAAITRYEYAIDDSGTWIDADLDLQETVPDLTNGQPYTFAVRAVNAEGDSPAATVTATPVTTPGAPQNLSWVPGDAQVTLSWDAPSSDGGAAITRYEYAIDASGTWIDAGLDLQETVTGLTNGQPYTFAVRAVNAAGDGPATTVTATPVTTPGAPQNLSWAPGDEQVTLSWDAPSSDGGAAITRYEYAIDDSGTWIDADLDLQETVPDLTNGQPYTFAVRAVNAEGDSPAATVTATPVTTPGAPENLGWAPGDGQVTLTWDAPSSDGGAAIARYEYEIDASGTWIDADLDLQETVPDLTNGQPYTVAVRAVNAAGGSPATTVTATPVATPGAPQNLSWTPGDEQATLTWDAPSSDGGAAITRYEYEIDASGTWIDAGLDLQETVPDLTNGQPYTVAVRAVNAAGDGPAATVTATTVTTPGVPENLGWAPGDGQVTLTWDAPSSDGGAAITRYEYEIDASGTWIDAGLDLQETVPDLANGQPYTFAVRAVNAAGDGPATTVTATPVTTPGAPQNLSWAPGDGQVTLSWDAPSSDGGAAITRYEYAIDDSGTWIDADLDLQETVPDLANGQPYTFAVRAVNAAGDGPATTVTATPVTTPGVPENLGWAPGDGQVTLNWDAPSSDGGAAITRYEYAIDASGTWIDADLDLQETVPDLANGQPYTFAVRAVNAAGDGPATTVTATPVTTPGVPENLGWAPGDGQVTLNWDAPSSDGGAAITRYEYAIDASGTWIDADLDLQETVPDLTNGQPYTFAVRAVNAAGGSPAAAVTATPATTAGAPHNLSWAPGDGQVTLTWDAPSSDGGAAITRYEYAIDDSGTWIDAGLDLQETVPGLTNGQPYTFAVRAVNAVGGGDVATVTATPVTTPGAPQNLSWVAGYEQVTLNWDAPASDGGAAITGYEYAIDDNGTWIDAGTDRRVTVSGLTNGQPYTFAVRAVNAVGGGDAATVTATPVTTPGAPQNLSWAPGDGQVTLTWDAPSSDGGAAITRYEYAIDDSGTWIDAGLDLQETVRGLTNGQPYTFAVRAVNAVGGGDVATVTATPVTTPGAPQNLSWVAGYEQVTLNWDAPASDGGAAITGYEYAIDDNGTWIDAGTDRRVTVSGLTNGQPYTFAVRAVNAVGGGDAATVTATPVTTPGAPQNLSGVPGNAQVTLSWDAPASDGGSAITGYEYAIDDNGTWIDAGTDRRVTVSGLTNGQPYTFAVRAVNAVGGGDAATVTIVSADPLPQAWLARFGRAAADHVVEAVSDRWRGGPPASHVTIGGRQAGDLFGWTGLGGQAERDTAADRSDLVRTDASSTRRFAPFGNAGTGVGGTGPGMTVSANDMNRAPVGLGGVDRETGATLGGHAAQGALLGAFGLPDPRALTDLGALLMGSSFSYSGAREEDGRARTPGWLGEWSAWGRAATSRFSGADGELSLDGEVATAMLGFDSRWRRWLAGVVVSHSGGQGAYTHPTATSGAVASSLTALHPYVHFALNERTNFWSVLGYGVGRLSLKPERSATALKTDLTNTMAAFGGRMSVRSARAGRFELAILSDARLTNTASDAAAGLAGAVGRTSRVRMMLEGSGSMPLAAGGMLKPTLEAGLRYDAGDAETGAGLEVGGGLGYAAGRLSVEVGARGLLAHQDTEYEEWGFSGSIAYTPSADGRGLSTRIGSAWGATQSGVQSLWSRQDASGLVRNTAFDGAQRYQAELRYGLDGLQGRARWAPYIGVESGGRSSQALRQGVTLTLGRHFDAELELGRRRVGPVADPEHAVQLRGTLRW